MMAFNRFAQVQCVALLADLGEVLGKLGPRRDRVRRERLQRHAAERRLQFVRREKGQHHLARRPGMQGPVRPAST